MSKSPVVCDHPAVAHFCPQDGMEVRPDSPPPFPVKVGASETCTQTTELIGVYHRPSVLGTAKRDLLPL